MNKDEILNKVDEIIDCIKETDVYSNYLKSKKIISLDQEIITLIEDIKRYQKEIVKNQSKKQELEDKINNNLSILNENPNYLEYMYFQEELNNMLTIFENKINKYFKDIFN